MLRDSSASSAIASNRSNSFLLSVMAAASCANTLARSVSVYARGDALPNSNKLSGVLRARPDRVRRHDPDKIRVEEQAQVLVLHRLRVADLQPQRQFVHVEHTLRAIGPPPDALPLHPVLDTLLDGFERFDARIHEQGTCVRFRLQQTGNQQDLVGEDLRRHVLDHGERAQVARRLGEVQVEGVPVSIGEVLQELDALSTRREVLSEVDLGGPGLAGLDVRHLARVPPELDGHRAASETGVVLAQPAEFVAQIPAVRGGKECSHALGP